MALYKRDGSKFYWTKFTFQGKLVQQSTKCSNKAKADVFEAGLKTQLNQGRIQLEDLAPKKALLFKDACEHFFDGLEDVKESTRRRYETAAKPLLAYFGKMAVDKIDQEQVKRYRKDRISQKVKAPVKKLLKDKKAKTGKPIKPATVNRECTLLAMVFRYLITVKKLKLGMPTLGLKQLKEDNITERLVTIGELAKYFRAASQPLRDVALVMYYTGMRPGEVLALTSNDVDFRSGVIIIRHGKTNAARRRNPLPLAVRGVLRRRSDSAHNGLLFPGGKEGQGCVPLVKVSHAHHGALERSGVEPFRLYDLRHSFATQAHASGMDLETLRVLGGWANLSMLKRYVKPSLEHKTNEMQKLQEYRRGKKANVIPFVKREAA